MANKLQHRRDTAANWTAANPILSAGEPALETDTKKRKLGDGTTPWNSLPYQASDQPTLDVTFAPSDLAWLSRGKLDIWAPFNTTGGAGSWDASTYANWIAGIDANLASAISAGTVVKVDQGASSDATKKIYSYTAGAANAPHALLIGGTHGNERLSQVAPMRWFEQFATGTHPAMRALRQTLKVTWIPTLTPPGYFATRDNANSINVNRNYDHLWQYFTEEPKGAAPFDQPEAAVVKKLIDQNKVSAVIDCHTTTMTTPNSLLFDSPSRMLAVRRDTGFGAAALWNQVYSDGTVPAEPYHLYWDAPAKPVCTHWAPAYMTYTKRRSNAGAVTIEAPEPFMGGSMTNFTRPAVQMYCGYITLWLTQWLLTGQTPDTPRAYEWGAGRNSWDDTAALGGGASLTGSSITPNGTTLYLPFDYGVTTQGQKYLDLFAPMPGKFMVTWHGSIENAGAVGGSVSVNPYMNPREDATPTAQVNGYVTFEIPAGAGKRASASSSFRYTVDVAGANKIHRLQLGLIRNFPDNTLYARRFTVNVRFVPDDPNGGIWQLPVVSF